MNPSQASASGRHDFDFLYGEWHVHQDRLNRRLAGETYWTDFAGRSSARPLLGGLGNLDENVLDLPAGRYEAVTIRLFDATPGRWSIWWIDARQPRIDAPVHGPFVDGIGTFVGDDVFEGRPIRVRFRWSGITADTASREQDWSADAGITWETNWTTRFARRV